MGNELTRELNRDSTSREQDIFQEIRELWLAAQNLADVTKQTPTSWPMPAPPVRPTPATTPRPSSSGGPTPSSRPAAPVVPSAPPLHEQPSVPQEKRPAQPYNYAQRELENLTRGGRLYPDLGGPVASARRPPVVASRPAPPRSPPAVVPRPVTPRKPAGAAPPTNDFVVVNRDGSTVRTTAPSNAQRSGDREEPSLACACCGRRLRTGAIYQCAGGHSSCADCRAEARNCGVCARPVTDMRSFALEVFIAQMKTQCPNARHGCKRMLTVDEEETHARECTFGGVRCPANPDSPCTWNGKADLLAQHFERCHSELCADAGAERVLPGAALRHDHVLVYLLACGGCHFVLRLEVAGGTVRATVHASDPSADTAQWSFELHVYNKAESRRKYRYAGPCAEPGAELAGPYAASFLNRDELCYKVFLQRRDRDCDHETEIDRESNREPSVERPRRPHSRQRPFKNKPFKKYQ